MILSYRSQFLTMIKLEALLFKLCYLSAENYWILRVAHLHVWNSPQPIHIYITQITLWWLTLNAVPNTHVTMLCTCAYLKCYGSTCFHTEHPNKFNLFLNFKTAGLGSTLRWYLIIRMLDTDRAPMRSLLFKHVKNQHSNFWYLFTFWDLVLLDSIWHQIRTWFPWVSGSV
jgi:hypothetical protein